MMLGLLMNSVFNTGVSIFFLISGYFGFNTNAKKIIRLEAIILFYSMLSSVCSFAIDVEEISMVRTCFPTVTGRYWFISVYMLLMMLGSYLEEFIDILRRKQFEVILVILLLFYSIVPTILDMRIVNDSRGKGVPNMLIMFFIGRYIKKYLDGNINRTKLVIVAIGSILIVTALDYAASIKVGFFSGKNATDDSIFIIIASVCIFMICKSYQLHCTLINRAATHVLAIYLMETNVRKYIINQFDLKQYSGEWYFLFLLAGVVLCIAITCIIVDIVREKIFVWILPHCEGKIVRIYQDATSYIDNKWNGIITIMETDREKDKI